MLDSFVYLMGSYVPVTSLLVMFVLGLCGYICYLTGYRKALADFPVDDVEHDEVAQLELRQTSTQERLGALEEQGFEERLDALEQQGFEERLDALEEQDYTEGYDRSPGSYWSMLENFHDRLAAIEKDIEHASTIRQGLLNTGLTHSERLEELERVNTKQVFDERVEHSVPFGQWALKVSERSKVNQDNIEDSLSPRLELLVERVEELERQT